MLRDFIKTRERKLSKSKRKYFSCLDEFSIKKPEQLFEEKCKFSKINLEIGFGNGENILHQARIRSDELHIGCEVYKNGISTLIGRLKSLQIENVKIYYGNAIELIRDLPSHILRKVDILFPEPWKKRKHHKRRIVNKENIDLIYEKMTHQGTLTIASDCTDYCQNIFSLIDKSNFFYKYESIRHLRDLKKKLGKYEIVKTKYFIRAKMRGSDIYQFVLKIDKNRELGI